ncbi:MAG: hypothetical protein M0Z31_15645 [Clostridia bacterium]|nr:hypothetical protein [Clostridia bacterium]
MGVGHTLTEFKRIIAWFMLAVLLMLFLLPGTALGAQGVQGRKVIVLVIDQAGWRDFFGGETPQLEKFASGGGVGLLNVRPKELLNTNPASSYLSIGMGIRATAPEGQVTLRQKDGWQVEAIEAIKNLAKKKNPNYRVGRLGTMARQQGLKVAVLSGGSNPEIALAAMDEEGKIPLVAKKSVNPGWAGEDWFLRESLAFLEQADLIFIDYGKGPQREEADRFIARLTDQVQLAKTLILIISPNTSKAMVEEDLNFGLTPIVAIGGWAQPGLLVSETTKRTGIVAASDLAPTIMNYLTGESGGWTGREIKVRAESQGLEKVGSLERFIVNINKTRFVLHGVTVLLISAGLILLFISRKFRGGLEVLVLTTLALPLVSLVAGLVTDYSYYLLAALGILAMSVVLAWAVRKLWDDFLCSAGTIAWLTLGLILAGSFINMEWLLRSPFGYNDLITGGRYYGLNNDIMGIMLGAAGLGLFTLFQRVVWSRWLQGLAALTVFMTTVLAFSPLYGSNVGGSMTALAMVLASLWVIRGKRLTPLAIGGIIILVVFIQVGIATLDLHFNSSLTHAGQAVQSLAQGGFNKFVEIVGSKLYQVMLMLVIPPWNLVLVAELAALAWVKFRRGEAWEVFRARYSHLTEGFLVLLMGSLVVFLFNDTGVISAALMLVYLVLPLGLLLPGRVTTPISPVREWGFTGKDM